MAYIRINESKDSLQLRAGKGAQENHIFYKGDVELVLSQDEVTAVERINAIVNGKEVFGLIGVVENDSAGAIIRKERDGDFMALSCPEFNIPPSGIELELE